MGKKWLTEGLPARLTEGVPAGVTEGVRVRRRTTRGKMRRKDLGADCEVGRLVGVARSILVTYKGPGLEE